MNHDSSSRQRAQSQHCCGSDRHARLSPTWREHVDESNRGELIDKVVKIKRCAAVVKGGRRFSFAAMVVVGNGTRQGRLGLRQGQRSAAQRREGRQGRLAQHDRSPARRAARFRTRSKATSAPPAWCWCRPAPGTGVIAGSARAAVCEAAGIHNILTKSFGSTNPTNLVKATMAALAAIAHAARSRAAARSDAVMNLHDVNRGIQEAQEAQARRSRPRLGHGKTSGRGHKGQGHLAGWTRSGDLRRRCSRR